MSKHLIWIFMALALAISAVLGGMAPIANSSTEFAKAKIIPADAAWRANLPRDPEAATKAFMDRLPAAAKERSDAYFEGGYWLQLHNFVLAVALALLLLWSKVLPNFRQSLAKRIKNSWLLNAATAAYYILLITILSLPLTLYEGFYREHQYGMSNMNLAEWLGEQLVGTVVAMIVGGVMIATLYVVLRRAPKTWWIWGSAVTLAFMLFMMLISPLYIDPLFNKYTPITDAKIKDPIMSMMRANGVPAENIYQFDASKQSNKISANVAGLFGTAAVRMNDNLLKRCTVPEINSVLGHELGHYVLNHSLKILPQFGLILVLGFVFVQWAMSRILQSWGPRWGVTGVADVVGVPLLAILFTAYMTVMTPVNKSVIRAAETEADLYGVNTSAEPIGFAEVILKLTEYRKSDPSDFEEFMFYDHPSPRKRILSVMRWRAEHMDAAGSK